MFPEGSQTYLDEKPVALRSKDGNYEAPVFPCWKIFAARYFTVDVSCILQFHVLTT